MKLSVRGVLAAAFIVGMCALCVRLGFWQLDRLEQRRARNAALVRMGALPPLALDAATADSIRRDPARFVNRRVTVRGTYLPQGEIVLRGRAHEGSPGVHLVTPLAVEGGRLLVMVNRGWAPSPDAATIDPAPFAEPGDREVTGLLQEIPVTDDGGTPSGARPGTGAAGVTYRRLDRAMLERRFGPRLLPLYVQQLPDPRSAGAASAPERVPAPALSEGSHLGYAIQWFSFAVIGLVGLAILLARERRKGA
jgi:surfeit locus 1 family protein